MNQSVTFMHCKTASGILPIFIQFAKTTFLISKRNYLSFYWPYIGMYSITNVSMY